RQVTPQEEIKIMLPLQLNQQYHLFFTFYKVSCKTKPGSREIIGYSVLPIYKANRLINDGSYSLPIASKLNKNYLLPFEFGKETDCLNRSNPVTAIKFMPAIFDYLLEIMCLRNNKDLQYYAFLALSYVINRISEYQNELNRCSIIIAYITHRLDNVTNCSVGL